MASINDNRDNYSVRGIFKRDFKHDHSGPEEIPHRKKGGKPAPKKKPGCEGNDGKAHIYVYVKYIIKKDPISPFGLRDIHRYRRVCLGCGRREYIRFVPAEDQIYETRHIDSYWELWG